MRIFLIDDFLSFLYIIFNVFEDKIKLIFCKFIQQSAHWLNNNINIINFGFSNTFYNI